jgi:hypothetical protein
MESKKAKTKHLHSTRRDRKAKMHRGKEKKQTEEKMRKGKEKRKEKSQYTVQRTRHQ